MRRYTIRIVLTYALGFWTLSARAWFTGPIKQIADAPEHANSAACSLSLPLTSYTLVGYVNVPRTPKSSQTNRNQPSWWERKITSETTVDSKNGKARVSRKKKGSGPHTE